MNHSQMILEYLRANGSITQQQAVDLFGCYRLSARIYDLRAAGHKITAVMMDGINRFGARTHFARYVLDQKKEVTCDG